MALHCPFSITEWIRSLLPDRIVEGSSAETENLLRELASLSQLGLLQWNIHAECFRACDKTSQHCDAAYPSCQENGTSLLHSLLADRDFAGLEHFDRSLALPDGFDQVQHSCGGAKGFDYPFDLARLVFSSRWRVKRVKGKALPPMGGCMEKVGNETEDYRAFVGQAFVHESGFEVLVVAAHFPHPHGAGDLQILRDALARFKAQTQLDQVLLLADTNEFRSNAEIMGDVDPSARTVTGSDSHITCCYPNYLYPFDRIIASNFPGAEVRTTLPFGAEREHRVPQWAALNMHDPVLTELYLRSGGRRGQLCMTLLCLLWFFRR
ncbi:unnamed protein product [Effrenium voratum]|nr:unnamed protein product [Effrenium voratum]